LNYPPPPGPPSYPQPEYLAPAMPEEYAERETTKLVYIYWFCIALMVLLILAALVWKWGLPIAHTWLYEKSIPATPTASPHQQPRLPCLEQHSAHLHHFCTNSSNRACSNFYSRTCSYGNGTFFLTFQVLFALRRAPRLYNSGSLHITSPSRS
jgi:hypothetical protein